jgi:hypothetical protein
MWGDLEVCGPSGPHLLHMSLVSPMRPSPPTSLSQDLRISQTETVYLLLTEVHTQPPFSLTLPLEHKGQTYDQISEESLRHKQQTKRYHVVSPRWLPCSILALWGPSLDHPCDQENKTGLSVTLTPGCQRECSFHPSSFSLSPHPSPHHFLQGKPTAIWRGSRGENGDLLPTTR